MSDHQLAALLALLAGLQFGFGTQLTRLGLQAVDSRTGTLVTIVSSTLLYWLDQFKNHESAIRELGFDVASEASPTRNTLKSFDRFS